MINETISAVTNGLVSTTLNCYKTNSGNVAMYFFAIVGLITVLSAIIKNIFTAGLGSIGIVIAFIKTIIKWVKKIFKKQEVE